MAIKDLIKRMLGYRLGGSYLSNMAIPPGWNYQRYLEIYGEVGWLYGAVSLIASSVAASEWKLYSQKAKGKVEEIDDHPLLDLFNFVNPFQTRYQFMLLLQTYLGLVGEAFCVLNFDGLRRPSEMWLAPPGYMNIVPSPDKYISHYEYKRGSQTLRLEIPEVIHIMDANPANPYRGTGAARSVSMDIEAEYYAARYQQRLFFNDATPKFSVEIPEWKEQEERKQYREEFLEMHQGWRNAGKPAFLWGGAKINMVALAPKDMEYKELRNANKKLILGAFHIPDSLMGASEVGSRARAEADEYIFSKYTIKPALIRIREAFNEQLCPLFDESLRLDFEDPVPADVTAERSNNREDFKAGILTREEARLAIGLDALPEKGQTYLIPFSVLPEMAKLSLPQAVKQTSRWNEEQKEAYWRGYVAKTESQEKGFKRIAKALWDEQEKEVIANLETTPGAILFDEKEAIADFDKAFKPLITLVFESALKDVFAGQEPEPAHTESYHDKQGGVLNEAALKWIAKRSLALAKLLNGTTIEELRAVLAEGFAAGESIPQLRNRIEEYYSRANRVRATMVARTEVITASARGTEEAYRELGVQKVEWYTALDERTCEECVPLHGKIYPIDEGPRPALHPQCRCVILSVTE